MTNASCKETSHENDLPAGISWRWVCGGQNPLLVNTRFRANWSNDLELVEECYLLLLNKANRVTGIFHVSRGGMTGTVVDVKIILVTALKSLASGIILAHNHPSGNLQPSQADVELTSRLRKACSVLDIAFLDHLILGMEGYYSFADEGNN